MGAAGPTGLPIDWAWCPPGLGLFVGQYGTDIPRLAAAGLIVIAPIVVVYLVFQRSFVNGTTQGARKG